MQKPVSNTYSSVLALHRLKAKIHLGVGKAEQSKPQDIYIDVKFYLPEPPDASTADDGEYICYGELAEKIQALCIKKPYRLIEYLTHEIHRTLRKALPPEVKVGIRLHKAKIPLSYVKDGASYSFTDLPPHSWVPPE